MSDETQETEIPVEESVADLPLGEPTETNSDQDQRDEQRLADAGFRKVGSAWRR